MACPLPGLTPSPPVGHVSNFPVTLFAPRVLPPGSLSLHVGPGVVCLCPWKATASVRGDQRPLLCSPCLQHHPAVQTTLLQSQILCVLLDTSILHASICVAHPVSSTPHRHLGPQCQAPAFLYALG